MDSTWLLLVIFVSVWIVTFFPAWFLFMKLIAELTRHKPTRKLRIGVLFVIYRLVIAAPYVALLITGTQTLDSFIKSLIVGLLVTGLVLSFVRIFAAHKIIGWLWILYGLVYDGLLGFYPYRQLLQQVTSRISPKPNMVIVDVGCGTGNVLRLLADKFADSTIVGFDPTISMISKARRKLTKYSQVSIHHAGALKYLRSLPDKSIDYITMVNVLYALEDRKAVWAEVMRVLRLDGKAIVTNSDKPGSKAIIKEHLKFAPWWHLLAPRLVLVGVFDAMISEFSKVDTFHFLSKQDVDSEIRAANGKMENVVRCYGGEEDGVNLLFTVSHH